MKPTVLWLVFTVPFWKVAFSEICQNEQTNQAVDVFNETCPNSWGTEGASCYCVVTNKTAWEGRPANCSGFGVSLDQAKAADVYYYQENNLTLLVATFKNESTSGSDNNKENWLWIAGMDYNNPNIWNSNYTLGAFEKNCSKVLVANETHDCYDLPCQDNCTFLCRDPCKNYTFGSADQWGIYRLPEKRFNEEITIECKYGPIQKTMTARCVDPENTTTDLQWKIDSQNCWTRSVSLENYAKLLINESNIEDVTKLIRYLTNDTDSFKSSEVTAIATILNNIANFGSFQDVISDDFYNIVNNVLNINETVLSMSQEDSNSTNSITDTVERFSESRTFPEEDHLNNTVSLPNIAVSLTRAKSDISTAISMTAKSKSVVMYSGQPLKTQKSTDFNVTITLPKEVFDTTKEQNSEIIFVLYRKVSFFKELGQKRNIRGYVVAASVRNRKITQLKKAIVIRYLRSADVNVKKSLCVFWSYSKNGKRGGWSKDGCEYRKNEKEGYDECHCNHLTSFAMLLDVQPENKPGKNKIALSIITYIGCAASLLGIVLTLLTMILFRELLSHISSKIFLNVCLNLGVALIVFLIAAEKSRVSQLVCTAASIMNHFLFLSALAWMVLEAYTMYLAFVKVLPKAALESKIPRFWICCLICWGIPAVIVGITIGLALDSYGNEHHCFLQGMPMIVGFFVPVAACVFCNTLTFFSILRSLLKSGSEITSTNKRTGKEQARRGIAISVFLGLTWISGLFAIGEAKLIFQYIFCIVNSLQGWLIFLFYCVLSSEVRAKYRNRCCQREVPPMSSLRSSASNTYVSNMSLGKFEEVDVPPAAESIYCNIDNISSENKQGVKKRPIN